MRYCATEPLFDSKWPRLTWCGGLLASYIEPFDECLLWVTAWGVWESSENLHLFYRVRESYGERRLLEDAPGHLFLKHEKADLATFVQVALMSGWDFHLLPTPKFGVVFVSHDEFVRLYSDDHDVAKQARDLLPGSRLEDAG
jgi:hypothetical protein